MSTYMSTSRVHIHTTSISYTFTFYLIIYIKNVLIFIQFKNNNKIILNNNELNE